MAEVLASPTPIPESGTPAPVAPNFHSDYEDLVTPEDPASEAEVSPSVKTRTFESDYSDLMSGPPPASSKFDSDYADILPAPASSAQLDQTPNADMPPRVPGLFHPESATDMQAPLKSPQDVSVPLPNGETSASMFHKAMAAPAVEIPMMPISDSDSERVKLEKTIGNVGRGFISGSTSVEGALGLMSPYIAIPQILASVPEVFNRLKEADKTPPWSAARHQAAADAVMTLLPLIFHTALSKKGGEVNAEQEPSLNAIQEKAILSDAETRDQNKFQAGEQEANRNDTQASGDNATALRDRAIRASTTWQEAIARNDPKAAGNAAQELQRISVDSSKSQPELLGDVDALRAALRTQSLGGENAGPAIEAIRARASQERQRTGQPIRESRSDVVGGAHEVARKTKEESESATPENVTEPTGVTEALAELNRRNGRAAELPTPENNGLGSEPIQDESSLAGFGPGAAKKGLEFQGRKPIRIANEDIDRAREARGAEPLMAPARLENPVLWDRVMSRIDETPEAPAMLVDRINDGKVKTTSDEDQVMLLHEEIRLRNEKAMEAERAVDQHSSPQEREDARANFDALEARIDQTERAARKIGTIAGRALQARQIAAYDDYTYASLETRARNAKGSPLTLEESNKIKAQAEEIKSLRDQLTKAQDQSAQDRASEVLDRLIKEVGRETKEKVKQGKGLLSILDDQAAAARARSLERRRQGRLYTGLDPEAVLDATIIGASHIAHGLKAIGEWSGAMVKDLGEAIRPHLDALFEKAKAYHDTISKSAETKRPKPTAIEKIATAAAEADEGTGLTNRMVFDLAREKVNAGVEGLDNVMQAVTADLEPHFPGLTVREVRDMFSDYGKVRFPSKDADLKALRDYRRQAQLVSALEDAESGLSPKRTGPQRDKPSARVLELQKQVQEAMQEAGITTAGDPTRLKTSLDKYKTLLDNRIADADRRLSENDYSKPIRAKTILDSPALAKQVELQQKQRLIDQQMERIRLKNRTGMEKLQDAAVKWKRTAILFSPRVFPKLIEAGLVRIATNPITRVLSQPLRLIPGLADKAPAQMGIGFRAEAQRIASTLASGPEAFRKLIGKSKLDALGKKRLLDNEMANFVGNAHGMIKEPVRQGEYGAAMEYYTRQAIKEGLDPREPAVQTTIVSNALADANWQVFMSDNLFSKHFSSIVVNSLRNSKTTGAKSLANAVQFMMPIVRVSSNIALQTARLQVGLPEAFIRIATAAKRGELADHAAELSHEDAQAIARSFSAGLFGTMLAVYAWQNPEKFGGVYGEHDATHKKTGMKPNSIQFGDVTLPGWMNHAPEAQFLNTIASARRVYDAYYNKGTGTANALTEAMAFSLMTPVKNLPFIDTWLRFFSGQQSAGRTFGQTVRGAIVPGGDSILSIFDSAQRHPQTFWDEIKLGVPGLRGTVPDSAPSAPSSSRSHSHSHSQKHRSSIP